jgi:phosphoadenosine phosphosulfate reductase
LGARTEGEATGEREVSSLARSLEGAHPEQVLRWAADRWPHAVALATGFGAEGCVLVDIVGRLRLPIRVFTLDTGYLFPETLTLWSRLEQRYGLSIEAVRPAPAAGEADAINGAPLHASNPDRCCFLRKVEPLQRFLDGRPAWVTAIRREQSPTRQLASVVELDRRFGLLKVNPLVSWTSQDVADHIRAFAVPTHPLHERGYTSIGCEPCTSPVSTGEASRAGRWRGSEKTECGLHVPNASPVTRTGDIA